MGLLRGRLGACQASVGLGGCASTQPAGVQLEDAEIASKIKAKLTGDPEINPFNIDVDVNEGVVRLSGNVEKVEARDEAVQLARDTEGVVRVIDDIDLAEGSLGERVDDTALVVKVKAKLTASGDLNPFNINVDAEDGVVTLMGRVESREKKELAGRIVVIDHGAVIADASPRELTARVPGKKITVIAGRPLSGADLAGLPARVISLDGNRATLLSNEPPTVLRELFRRGVDVVDLEVSGADLEEAFLALTRRAETVAR